MNISLINANMLFDKVNRRAMLATCRWARANREDEMRRSIGFMFLAMLASCPDSAWALANPASVFCVKSGGKSEIRNGARGQYGVCLLPDGRVVEEWAYFREMQGKAGR
jgi:putative hemolysin